jgi:hypothetical protein
MTTAQRVKKHRDRQRDLLNRLLDLIERRVRNPEIRALAAALRPGKKTKE